MVLIRRADVHQRLRALLVDEMVAADASLDDTIAAVRRELTGLREELAKTAFFERCLMLRRWVCWRWTRSARN
jgi:hypothetical protein